MDRISCLSIQNASVRLRIVMLEPWGREFLLAVDEKMEITAHARSANASARLVESNNRTVVFVEGYSGVCVIKDEVSHNLDPGPLVGASEPGTVAAQSRPDPMWDRDLDANVVFGSWFLGGTHRVIDFWHSLVNSFRTLLSNGFG